MKKLFILLLLICNYFSTSTQIKDFNVDIRLYTDQLERRQYEQVYEKIIDFIKYHEHFVNHKYHTGADTDGWTIGYGHLIKKGEVFPNTISKEYADSLLRADFEGAKYMVKFYTPILTKPENKYKLLAMTHFVFAKGIGNFNRSKLKIYVEHDNINHLFNKIEEEIVKWSIVTFNKVRKRNKRMVKSREYELKIYNIKPLNL